MNSSPLSFIYRDRITKKEESSSNTEGRTVLDQEVGEDSERLGSVETNGRNMMTPYKGILSEQEIKDVAAYTLKLTNAHKK